MQNTSYQIIVDLYKKYGGVDLTWSFSNCAIFILNKITGKELYSKSDNVFRIEILKNNQKNWEYNSDDNLQDELVKYIEKETLLFKLEMLKEN